MSQEETFSNNPRYAAIYQLLSYKLKNWEKYHPNEYPFVQIRLIPLKKTIPIPKENKVEQWFKDRKITMDAEVKVTKTAIRTQTAPGRLRHQKIKIITDKNDLDKDLKFSPDQCSYSYSTDVKMSVTYKDLDMAISVDEGPVPENVIDLIEIEDQTYNIKVHKKRIVTSDTIVAMRAMQINTPNQSYEERSVKSIEDMVEQLKHSHVLINKKIKDLEKDGLSRDELARRHMVDFISDYNTIGNDKSQQVYEDDLTEKKDIVRPSFIPKPERGVKPVNIEVKEKIKEIEPTKGEIPINKTEMKTTMSIDVTTIESITRRKINKPVLLNPIEIKESFLMKGFQKTCCSMGYLVYDGFLFFKYTKDSDYIFKDIKIYQPFTRDERFYYMGPFKFKIHIEGQYDSESEDSFVDDDNDIDDD